MGYTIDMKLTHEQSEKAIALRGLLKSKLPENEGAWESYLDFTRAMGKILDGMDVFVPAPEMKKAFAHAWSSFAELRGIETRRMVLEALDGNQELFEQVEEHPNSIAICRRIVKRIEKKKGSLFLGVQSSDVDITDILEEDMPELFE